MKTALQWLAVHDDRLFLISGYMTTGYGRTWKRWPHHAAEDDLKVCSSLTRANTMVLALES